MSVVSGEGPVVSGEGPSLVACSSSSSSAKGKEEKHVVINYTLLGEKHLRFLLVCLPVDSLIPSEAKESPCMKFELELPCSEDLNNGMSCICAAATTGVGAAGKRTSPGGLRLYFFGGWDPQPTCPFELQKRCVLKKAYCYDLHKLPEKEVGSSTRCKEMIFGMSLPLLAQVGDDCIYVLGKGKTTQVDDNRPLKPAFQEYNFKKDEWTLLDLFDISKCDCDKWTRDNLGFVPHVVIGRKLHVSLGNSSFTFDTHKRVWKNCKLFETFWSEQKKKSGRLSPSNFYGSEVWKWLLWSKKKRKRNKIGCGGPPFGFYGRGILWDKNILLGVHYAPDCILVAFLLDDKGRVVKSQPFTLDNLVTRSNSLDGGARLVDFGRDGYFGLVHTISDYEEMDTDSLGLELVTFQVKKIGGAPESDDDADHFLECKVVCKEMVNKGSSLSIGRYYSASCV